MIKDRNRYEAISKITGTDNELLFEHGLSVKDIAGVVCQNSDQLHTLLGHFKKAGIGEINGIPIEKFIILKGGESGGYAGGFDREWISKNLHGLQEGGLS